LNFLRVVGPEQLKRVCACLIAARAVTAGTGPSSRGARPILEAAYRMRRTQFVSRRTGYRCGRPRGGFRDIESAGAFRLSLLFNLLLSLLLSLLLGKRATWCQQCRRYNDQNESTEIRFHRTLLMFALVTLPYAIRSTCDFVRPKLGLVIKLTRGSGWISTR
jgi:hypothetical protein